MSTGSGQFDWSIPGEAPLDPGRDPSPTPAPPQVIDRYQILGELGRGGMGVVYRARDIDLDCDVALKVILDPGYDMNSSRRERLKREGEVTAALQHPGIVKVLRAGEVLGQPYLVYELVDRASSLLEAFDGAGLTQRVEWLRDAARALGHAHARGVLHRDVKPDNILLDRARRVRVTDFGLAAGRGLDRLTRTGAIVGTPTHAAPEQLLGHRDALGPWTDVWSLGVILYQALTDTLPFDSRSLIELARLVTESEPPSVRSRNPAAPATLIAVCERALAKDPDARYADADAFADDLDAWLSNAPVSGVRVAAGRGPGRVGIALGLTAIALASGGLGWVLSRPGGEEASPAAATPSPPAVEPLALALEPLPARVHTQELKLRGRVRGAAWPVELSVQERRVRLTRDAPFEVSVPLSWGQNTLEVQVVDRRGGVDRATHTVTRGHPDWVGQRWPSPRRRPPGPLPQGVRYGEAPGEFVNVKDGSVLVWVPGGAYRRGWNGGNPRTEAPEHQVTIRRGFFIGKYEVTVAQFERFVRETGRKRPMRPEPPSDRHPAVFLSWDDAQAYCAWAGLRLPTEAQWELAARGRGSRRFPWGDGPERGRLLNAQGKGDPYPGAAPVGSFPAGASPCGALDMAGNVFEWVLDGGANYKPEPQVDPFVDPAPAPARVIRGGAFNVAVSFCRTSYRDFAAVKTWTPFIGFRVSRPGY